MSGWEPGTVHPTGGYDKSGTDSGGTSMYWRKFSLHRDDGPAATWMDGTRLWYIGGKLHREDGPAILHPDGTQEWYLDGVRHRIGGPAIERADASAEFWEAGALVRKVDRPQRASADEEPHT